MMSPGVLSVIWRLFRAAPFRGSRNPSIGAGRSCRLFAPPASNARVAFRGHLRYGHYPTLAKTARLRSVSLIHALWATRPSRWRLSTGLVHRATNLEMNVECYRLKAALKRTRGPAGASTRAPHARAKSDCLLTTATNRNHKREPESHTIA